MGHAHAIDRERGTPPRDIPVIAPPLYRSALLHRLRAQRPRLVVFVAPTGFGKSTFARTLTNDAPHVAYADFMSAGGMREAGLRLLDAFRILYPDHDLVASGSAFGGTESDVEFRQNLLRIWYESETESTLILENLEALDGLHDVHDLLHALLSRPIHNRSVVLCSRPPLTVRANRFAAPNESAIVGTDDLRFDADDIAAALPSATASERVRAARLTGGWPMAVLWLAKEAQHSALARTLDNIEGFGFDALRSYICAHAIDAFPTGALSVMLACIAVPQPTLADIRAILGPDDAQRGIDSIAGYAPFATARHDGTLTVHPMIAAELRHRYAERLRAMAQHAAHEYARNGNALRAAEIFIEIDDIENTNAVIEHHGILYNHEFLGAHSRLLKRVDQSRLTDFPGLWIVASSERVFARSQTESLREAEHLWSTQQAREQPLLAVSLGGALVNYYIRFGRIEDALTLMPEFEKRITTLPMPLRESRYYFEHGVLAAHRGHAVDIERASNAGLLRDPYQVLYFSLRIVLPVARLRLDVDTELRKIDELIDLVPGVTLPGQRIEALVEIAFHMWRTRDDERSSLALEGLRKMLTPALSPGITFFLDCATGRAAFAREAFETPWTRFYGYLIAAGSAGAHDEALRFALRAREVADKMRGPYQRVLARLAIATIDPAHADDVLAEAHATASQTAYPEFAAQVQLVRDGAGERSAFAQFITRFAERPALERSDVELLIPQRRVLLKGTEVPLSGKPFEVLAALALARAAIPTRTLAAMVWPTMDGQRAQQSLRVQISTLRARFGTEIIEVQSGECSLGMRVLVDLYERESLLRRALYDDLTEAEYGELRASKESLAARGWEHLTWEWFAPYEARYDALLIDVFAFFIEDALAKGRPTQALAITTELLALDPSDERAHELLNRARHATSAPKPIRP
jgi:hypothetical protein